MPRLLTCTRCGAPAEVVEDVEGYIDWGRAEIGDDGVLRPVDTEHRPQPVMADSSNVVGRPRACCTNRACGRQWRIRRHFDPDNSGGPPS